MFLKMRRGDDGSLEVQRFWRDHRTDLVQRREEVQERQNMIQGYETNDALRASQILIMTMMQGFKKFQMGAPGWLSR